MSNFNGEGNGGSTFDICLFLEKDVMVWFQLASLYKKPQKATLLEVWETDSAVRTILP